MSQRMVRSRRSLATLAASFAVLATLALAGCGSDNNTNPTSPGGGGGSTTYVGTISGATTSGSLTLTIATTSPSVQPGPARATGIVTASGTLVLSGGGSVALTGTYDTGTHAIGVSGGGWTLSGGLTSFGMEGGYTGPAAQTGVFSVQNEGSGSDTVIVVVGTFTSTSGGSSGNFNFSIRGTVIHGNAVDDGGTVVPLDGTYTAAGGAVSIAHPSGGAPLATGILETNGIASGTYDDRNGNSGNWNGTRH